MSLLSSLGFQNDGASHLRNRRSNDVTQSPFATGTPYSQRDASFDYRVPRDSTASASRGGHPLNANTSFANMSSIPVKRNETVSNGKYGSLPRKSMLNAGLSGISPFQVKLNSGLPNQRVSPVQQSRMNTALSLHNAPTATPIAKERELMVIGFPASESTFVHRKFASYGTILRADWDKNTLFIEYEHKQNAERALAENATWIKNGHHVYMVAVLHAENAQQRKSNESSDGRTLSVNQENSYHGRANQSYFSKHSDKIERSSHLKQGQNNMIWSIFEFLTTGW